MLAQPDFLQIIQSLGNNPSLLSNYMGDPRLQKALMVSFRASDVCVLSVCVHLIGAEPVNIVHRVRKLGCSDCQVEK